MSYNQYFVSLCNFIFLGLCFLFACLFLVVSSFFFADYIAWGLVFKFVLLRVGFWLYHTFVSGLAVVKGFFSTISRFYSSFCVFFFGPTWTKNSSPKSMCIAPFICCCLGGNPEPKDFGIEVFHSGIDGGYGSSSAWSISSFSAGSISSYEFEVYKNNAIKLLRPISHDSVNRNIFRVVADVHVDAIVEIKETSV